MIISLLRLYPPVRYFSQQDGRASTRPPDRAFIGYR